MQQDQSPLWIVSWVPFGRKDPRIDYFHSEEAAILKEKELLSVGTESVLRYCSHPKRLGNEWTKWFFPEGLEDLPLTDFERWTQDFQKNKKAQERAEREKSPFWLDPNLEHLRPHVEKLYSLLDLRDHIQIRMPRDILEMMYGGSYFGYCFLTKERSVILNMSQCLKLKLDPISILAHELRHAWQYQTGIMDLNVNPRNGRVWKGEFVSDTWVQSQEDYEKLPWEADANDFARSYMDEYLRGTKVA
jgi:hypothetical protein